MTAHCPSHDWDRHVAEQDDAAEAERAFYLVHRDRIVTVAAAIVASPFFDTTKTPANLADAAASIVREIVARGEPIE